MSPRSPASPPSAPARALPAPLPTRHHQESETPSRQTASSSSPAHVATGHGPCAVWACGLYAWAPVPSHRSAGAQCRRSAGARFTYI
eukprot:1646773-Prymnesium_polylepis.1